MRVVRYTEFGGPEVLRIEEVPDPEPGAGQVLVRPAVIGAGFIDTVMRRGVTPVGQPPLPGSPHGDVVGTVVAVGADLDAELVGQRVAVFVDRDAYADLVVADATWLVRVPDGVADATATVLPMPGPVALGVLNAGLLTPGETVLVHAAAGGIGHLVGQLAAAGGAGAVIGAVSTPEKAAFARRHGATATVCTADADWPDQVRALAPDGVDVVADSIGGATTATSLTLLAPEGRLVIYGLAEGLPEIPATHVFNLRSVTGFGINQWRAARPHRARRDLEKVAEHAAAGRLNAVAQATLPITEAAEAHRLLEDRTRTGRVLLTP